MSPSSSSFKKKLRQKKPGLVHRVKRVVSAHEHSYVKTALSQSRISNMNYKKRIQKLLENNKDLAQALEAAEVTQQQQEQVILSLQKQLTLNNPSVIKRNIKKMGILIQEVVNLMADTLEQVIHVDDDDQEDITDVQLPPLPATDASNTCSVPDYTPVKHSATGPLRRSLHNDLREKFGICDLTVINEDTLRLQEMTLPPILFTDGEDISNSRHSKRNSSRHKSSRKGSSTKSLSRRGSTVESSDPSGRNCAKSESEECEELNDVRVPSANVSSQHNVLNTPTKTGRCCSESPSLETSCLQTPKTPIFSPIVFSMPNQVMKSNIPRLVRDNIAARSEILHRDSSSVPVQRRETFVISSAASTYDVGGGLKRSPNKLVTVNDARVPSANGSSQHDLSNTPPTKTLLQTASSNKSTVTGLSSSKTKSAIKAQHSEITLPHTAQTAFPVKEALQQVPNISDDAQKRSCMLPQVEDVTVNLNEDMELTCPVGNFLAPFKVDIGKTQKIMEPSLVNEIKQPTCNNDKTSDLTEIYCSQEYYNLLSEPAKLESQPNGETAQVSVVSQVNENSNSVKQGSLPTKEGSGISVVDVMSNGGDEASDITEIYNVKTYYNAASLVPSSFNSKDFTDKKLPTNLQGSPADVHVVSKNKGQKAVSNSDSPPKDHKVKVNSESSVSGVAEPDPHACGTVAHGRKESDVMQLNEGFVSRTKSKGNHMVASKTISSPLNLQDSLQPTNRRGTFVVPRNAEENSDSQSGLSNVSSLSKRKSKVRSSIELNRLYTSQPVRELRGELKFAHNSPSEKHSPYKFPEKDCISESQERKVATKSSKKSLGKTCALGRKKLHLSQFSKAKPNSKKGSTDKEPKFKFFSKKTPAVLLKNVAKIGNLNQNDVATSGSGNDKVVEMPLNSHTGKETTLKTNEISPLKDTFCSQEFTRSVQKGTDVSDKTKAAEFSGPSKRKSDVKESIMSKKAKFENKNQSKNEGNIGSSAADEFHGKDQLSHQPNLRSYHKRKSVSFRMPSDNDIHLFNQNESIHLSSEIELKTNQAKDVRDRVTQIESNTSSPAVVEFKTSDDISEDKQCKESFVVLEDIFPQVSIACYSSKQNDGAQHKGIVNCAGLQPSNIARSPVKKFPSRSKSLKRDRKSERSISNANVISQKQIDCGLSDPSCLSEEGKGKESSTPGATHNTATEVHESDKGPEKVTTPYQVRKSTRRGKGKESSTSGATHNTAAEIHESDKGPEKVTTPYQVRKSTRRAGNKDFMKDKCISDEVFVSADLLKSSEGNSPKMEVMCMSTENKTSSVNDANITKSIDFEVGDKKEGSIAVANPASGKQTPCEAPELPYKKKRSSKIVDTQEEITDARTSRKGPSNCKNAQVPHQSKKSSQKGGHDVPTESSKNDVSNLSEICETLVEVAEGLGRESESSGRLRRRRTDGVSYKEPSLGAKLRRGDVFFPGRN